MIKLERLLFTYDYNTTYSSNIDSYDNVLIPGIQLSLNNSYSIPYG